MFYHHKPKIENRCFFIIAIEYNQRSPGEKPPDDVKDELLSSLINIDNKDEPGLDVALRNAKDPKEGAIIIKE